LGFNVDLPDPHEEPPGWVSDIEALLELAVQLRREFDHDIVVGISDNHTDCAEDIAEIDSDEPDVDYVRRFVGIQPPVAEHGSAANTLRGHAACFRLLFSTHYAGVAPTPRVVDSGVVRRLRTSPAERCVILKPLTGSSAFSCCFLPAFARWVSTHP
jgi:hypothetical protein